MTGLLLAFATAGAAVPGAVREGPSLAMAAGVVAGWDRNGTPWLSASLRLPLGPSLSVEPEVGYWKTSVHEFGLTEHIRGHEVGLSVVLRGRPRTVRAFVGQGLVLRFERVTFSHPLYAPPDFSQTHPAIAFFGGVEVRRGPVSAFVAARAEAIVFWGFAGKVYAGIRVGPVRRRPPDG